MQVNNENNTQQNNSNTLSHIPRLTIRIPPRNPPPNPPPNPPSAPHLQCSERLHGIPPFTHAAAFISEYVPIQDTHNLFHADLCLEDNIPVKDVLQALTDGTIEPILDAEDEPTWVQVMASNEREY